MVPRSRKRQTLADKLKAENTKLKAENEQLRDAGRQLMAGLSEYCKAENWEDQEESGRKNAVWIGNGDQGDGPKTARYYLGLEEEKN